MNQNMNVSPWIRTPFTDLTATMLGNQWGGKCADLELNVIECFEAYGLNRGQRKCDDMIQDFKECQYRIKQMKRHEAMMLERERQYNAGERTKENRYAIPPTADSFHT